MHICFHWIYEIKSFINEQFIIFFRQVFALDNFHSEQNEMTHLIVMLIFLDWRLVIFITRHPF